MIKLPLPTIYWRLASKIFSGIIDRLKIDISFEKTETNPFVMVAFDIARVRYQLIVRTYGWPKIQPNVVFTKVKGLGKVVKRAVSPSGLGEVDGAMRLRLYKNEIPSNSELPLNVDFEIEINPESLVSMDFPENQDILDENNPEIEILCTNNCDFPLEQILLSVRKSISLHSENPRVFILDKSSHRVISEVGSMAIRKGDDYIKWITRFNSRESLLFRIVAR